MNIAGVILAGGRSTRMGADKAGLVLGGKPLWRHVAERLSVQTSGLVVVAPSPPAWLGEVSATWIPDAEVTSGGGPALGLLAALQWLEQARSVDAVLTAPVDAPFLPLDLGRELSAAMSGQNASCAVVRRPDGLNPTFGLWCRDALAPVEAALIAGENALHRLAAAAGATDCNAWDAHAIDPFFNVNTPDDLSQAETWLARSSPASGGA